MNGTAPTPAANAQAQNAARQVVMRMGAPLAAAGAAAIVLLMAWPGHAGTAGSWDVDYAVPSTLLIFGLAIAPSGTLARFLSLPLLVLFGEASYAVFMIHRRILNVFVGPAGVPPTIAGVIFALMLAGLTICAAVGLHLLFERPASRLVRRLAGPRRSRSRAGAA